MSLLAKNESPLMELGAPCVQGMPQARRAAHLANHENLIGQSGHLFMGLWAFQTSTSLDTLCGFYRQFCFPHEQRKMTATAKKLKEEQQCLLLLRCRDMALGQNPSSPVNIYKRLVSRGVCFIPKKVLKPLLTHFAMLICRTMRGIQTQRRTEWSMVRLVV